MDSYTYLESYYKKYIKNINYWVPEGITPVNISLLHKLDLLDFKQLYTQKEEDAFKGYFRVFEDPEKITLVNEQFIIWITPQKVNGIPVTYTLIALNEESGPRLEVVLQNSGVYNSSRLVLNVLEKYLLEIQENEDILKNLKKAS